MDIWWEMLYSGKFPCLPGNRKAIDFVKNGGEELSIKALPETDKSRPYLPQSVYARP